MLLIFLIFVSSCDSSKTADDTKWWIEELCEENIFGTWHGNNHVAGAYTEIFVFHRDHTFSFYTSQYAYEERELRFWGRWELKDEYIVIRKEFREILVGGVLKDGVLSGTQEYVGSEIVTEKIDPIEVLEISLSLFIDQTVSGVVLEESDIIYPSVYFNGVQYWRLSHMDIINSIAE